MPDGLLTVTLQGTRHSELSHSYEAVKAFIKNVKNNNNTFMGGEGGAQAFVVFSTVCGTHC